MREAEEAISLERQGFVLASHRSRVARSPGMADTNAVDQLGLTPEHLARLERETATVSQDFRVLEESHGDDVLNLACATRGIAGAQSCWSPPSNAKTQVSD